MGWAIREFVSACDICARVRSSTQHSAGELQHLPVPTWSHVNDFVTSICLLTISTLSLPLWIDSKGSTSGHVIRPPFYEMDGQTLSRTRRLATWVPQGHHLRHGAPIHRQVLEGLFHPVLHPATTLRIMDRQYGPTNNWDAFVMLHLHLIVSLALLCTSVLNIPNNITVNISWTIHFNHRTGSGSPQDT